MNITFFLRDTPGKKGYKVRLYLNHNGKAFHNTEYTVQKSDWDAQHGRFKETRPNAIKLNSKLIELRNEVERLCLDNPNTPAADIFKLLGKGGVESFKTFYQKFLDDCLEGKQVRAIGTYKKYKEIFNAINKYGKPTDFNTINQNWFNDYTNYLRTPRIEKDANGNDKQVKGLNENSVGNHIKAIKAIMRMALDAGVSKNNEFQKKYFKKTTVETDSIYLNESEMELWSNVDLSNFDHLQTERDRFLIQYYFLLRFGDSLRFDQKNFYTQDGQLYMKMRSEKTKTETIVPVSTKALEILKKYDFDLPPTSNYEANWKLKEIGELAGIKEMISINGLTRPKYKFITTHTARRSGATNLYLQGAPDKIVMDMGGWKKINTFRAYIRLSKLESAQKALNYDFFK